MSVTGTREPCPGAVGQREPWEPCPGTEGRSGARVGPGAIPRTLPRHGGALVRDGASPGRRPGSARRADPIPEEEVPAVNEMP